MKDADLELSRLAFIGGGNMAEALLQGILENGLIKSSSITVAEPVAERREELEQQYGVNVTRDNRAAVKDADIIVLSVKPQVMPGVLKEIEASANRNHFFISIAAGLRCSFFEARLGEGARVVRVMPNTPALVEKGASAICRGASATEQDLKITERILASVGLVVSVPEKDMDAVTAVSGSGPAYVFLLIEAMIEAGVKQGLEVEVARELAVATVEGAGTLAAMSGDDPSALRERVTSRGGTTAAALGYFEQHGFRELVAGAVKAAADRSRELSGS